MFDGRLIPVMDGDRVLYLEFDNVRFAPGQNTPGSILIPYDPGQPAFPGPPPIPAVPATTADQITQTIVALLNQNTNAATAQSAFGAVGKNYNRVEIRTYQVDLTTQLEANDDRLVINGPGVRYFPGSAPIGELTQLYGYTLIDAESTYNPALGRTDHLIANRVADVVGSHQDYRSNGVGGAYSRINFPDAQTGDFKYVPRWNVVATSTPGVSAGNERIVVLADDTPLDRFVDRNFDGLNDDLNGDGIRNQTGVIRYGDQPGVFPFGDQMPGLSRKVSDAINSALSSFGISAVFRSEFVRLNRGSIENLSAMTTQGDGPGGKVTGLTVLPNGAIFAVSDQGGLYRINNPTGAASATYIASSEHDLLGLAFSGLTSGPPNVEDGRYANMLFATDSAGRIYAFNTQGVLQPIFVNGQTSISTGVHNREVRGLAFSTLDWNLFHTSPVVGIPDEYRFSSPGGTYNFPGGAHGSLVSNEFSLKGYSAADRPALYFDYHLDTEGAASSPTQPMRDSFRVFIADNSGDWQLLSTNNSYLGPLPFDDELQDIGPFDVQEAFDANEYRQVRVALDQFAGLENLRIRLDFSSAGTMNVGNINTRGEEIRTVSGVFIADGDTVQIGNRVIEFDSGYTLTAPTGSAIQPGEQITIYDSRDQSLTLQFVEDVLTLSDIVAVDGSQLNDGDTFQINDGSQTVTFEFDTGFILRVPAAGGGGIADQQTFIIDPDGDGAFPPLTFEFDKNGVLIDANGDGIPDTVGINIMDDWTLVVPPQGSGLGGVRDQDQFSLRRGTTTFTFELDTNGVRSNPGNQLVNIADNLTLFLPAAGGGFGGVVDGSYFTIDPDGPAGADVPLVFEFREVGTSRPAFGNALIPFTHFTTQDMLADAVVAAVASLPTRGLQPVNLGNGTVILDGTTPAHRLDTSFAAPVTSNFTPLTQQQVVQRIITALDVADGLTPPNSVLGLALPNPVDVQNGAIVLGGTTPDHVLNVGGGTALVRTTTPKSQQEVADRIAQAINNIFVAATDLRAASLPGGLVNVLDLSGDTDLVVDVTGAPGMVLTGIPGVTPGHLPISFLPTDTLDQIIEGAPPVVAGAAARPGMVVAINGSGLQVLAERSPFPNEEIITLTGTAGNQVAFAPGVSALQPKGIVPIYVAGTQTANDVAERIAAAILQAVANGDLEGVTPRLNGNLGYSPPSINPGEVRLNRINLQGVTNIVLGSTDSLFLVEGSVGVAPGNAAAVVHTDMTRVQVANVFDSVLEGLFHNPTIITETGLRFADGETFSLSDGVNPAVTFEFDAGFILNIPVGGGQVASGGISDGEYFIIQDAIGFRTATFEFDKDGIVTPGRTAIPIREGDSPLAVARMIVSVVQTHPNRAILGLAPRLLTGNRVQLGGTVGTTLTIGPGSQVTQSSPRVATIPTGGGAVINDGATIAFSDGVTTIRYEFNKIGGVAPGNRPVPITNASTPNQVAQALVTAIQATPNRALLNLNAYQLDFSRLAVEASANVSVQNVSPVTFATASPSQPGVSPSMTLELPATLSMQLPDPLTIHIPSVGIADGETFTINDGFSTITFEFENLSLADGVDPLNQPVNITSTSTTADIGRAIVDAIDVSGLAFKATMIGGVGNIDLGGSGQIELEVPLGSPLMKTGSLSLQAPNGGGAALTDGDFFVIRNGPVEYRFEFDNLNINDGVTPGSYEINFDPVLDTQNTIADRIIATIATVPGLNTALNPIKTTGAPRVHLSATVPVTLNTTLTHLTQTGSSRINLDNRQLVIGDNSQFPPLVVPFEFDMDGGFSPGSAIVDIAPGSTLHQIASEIIREINASGLNLAPVWNNVRTIELAAPAGIQLDTSQVPTISQFGQSGAFYDGLTFLLTEAGVTRRLEFDSNGVFSPNSIVIPFSNTETTDQIAAKVVSAISPASSGFNVFPRYLGNGVINIGGSELHAVTLTTNLTDTSVLLGSVSFRIPAAGSQIGGVVDGEMFTITDDTTGISYVFEFSSDLATEAGTIAIPFAFGDSQNAIGQSVVNVVRNVAGLNLSPSYRSDGIVDFQTSSATHTLSFQPTVLVTRGVAGARVPHVPVVYSPSDDFTANDMAIAIRNAVNTTLGLNIQATVGGTATADQRRVELRHTTGFPTDIAFVPDVDGDLTLEAPQNLFKQDQDLVRIIGHRVVDPGPLGYVAQLPGDQFGLFSNIGTTLPSYRAMDNQHGGLRLDDFIIGFAERGELVTNAADDGTGFGVNPRGGGRTEGEYQLEIRRGPGLTAPLVTGGLARSMDTNDRLGTGTTLIVPHGLHIADGQTLTLSDGVQHVVFEYVDQSIPNNVPQPGRIAVPFLPSDPDYVVAQRVRDAINGSDAQAVLQVTAAITDGTLIGVGDPTPSTSGRVNLFGPVTLKVHSVTVDEANDTMAQATPTGVAGLDSAPFFGSGVIGDNPNLPLRPGLDVDMFQVSLSAGIPIRVDVDAQIIGSELNSVLRIFNAAGNQVAFSNRNAAPGEFLRRDPYLQFTPLTSGTYYIAVSGANNLFYDPRVEGSGSQGSTGFYDIKITYGASTGADFILYDDRGDSNLFRDQGQLLIHANTITNSAEYGIVAAAAERYAQDGFSPHAGPVRMTPKRNLENLAPGVVIANNVLAENSTGGIRFAGDPNAVPNGQEASVPFGRIVNNTIYGGVQVSPTTTLADVVFMFDTSGSMAADVAEFRARLASLDAQFQAANIDANYGLVTFPGGNPGGAPRQLMDITTVGAFLNPSSPFNTFLTGGDAQEFGSLAVREALNTFDATTTFTYRPGADIVLVMVTDEDDDSTAADFTVGLTSLLVSNSLFFGVAQDPNSPASGNTGQRYGEFARQTGGQLLDIDSLRRNPQNFFNAFGQIVIGSLVGGLGAGITIENNASPTVLNNVLSSLATGISVDGTSQTTVIGGSLYQNNGTNSVGVVTEDFPIFLDTSDPLFRDPSVGNFYPAPLSRVIDSSVGSLLERFDLKQVKNILGIADSPILAPSTDITGQLRVDDPQVETPAGFGENVFADRGAVDRSDFVGPTVQLLTPRDNDTDGLDQNRADTAVRLSADTVLTSFQIRLIDGVPPADAQLGSGVDDLTVTTGNVSVFRDGVELVDGIDYSFSYNATSDTIVVTPLSGIWEPDRVYVIRVNNRDYYRITASNGWELPDGWQFLVRDVQGDQETFEFESGYTLQVPQTLQIIVPEAGGSLGGVRDGETFTIQRVAGTTILQSVVFEFDSNGIFTDNNLDGLPDNRLVTFSVADSAEDIAQKMVTQIFNANLQLRPSHIGDGVIHLGSTEQHRVDIARARSLQVTGQASGIEDGDFFTIDDGTKIVTFEFDSDGLLTDSDGDGVPDRPGAALITFNPGLTNDQIAARIVTAVSLADVNLTPVAIGSGQVHLGGIANVHLLDVSGSQLTSIGAPGVRSAFGIQIPTVAGQPRFVPDATGTPYLTDGEIFSITDGTRAITFELDDQSDPRNGGRTVAPNVVVAFYSTDFGIRVPTNADGTPRVAPDGTPVPYLRDGDTFTLTDGTRTVRFELDDLDATIGGNSWNSANVPIHYSSTTSTTDDIANAIRDAIAGSTIQGLSNLRNIGGGIVLFGEPAGGTSLHALNVTPTGLEQMGAPGVRASTVNDIANVIVAAIQNAPLSGLNPTNAGNGVIHLGELTDGTSRHAMDLSQTGLAPVGSAGIPAAIPVYVTPVRDFDESGVNNDFDGAQVAVALRNAINGSPLAVTATPAGANVVEIVGAVTVLELDPVFVDSTRFVGVKDLAGNPLKPNLLSGDTQFSIVLGQAAMDFGDAPQTLAGSYPTQLGLNGPFHMITANPIFLGQRVDAEPDGQVSPDATGDHLDGEGFVIDTAGAANMYVVNGGGGLVNAGVTPGTISLPLPLTLQVGAGTGIQDGARFRVTNNDRTVDFELDLDGNLNNPTAIRVAYSLDDSALTIADTITRTVRAQTGLRLAPSLLESDDALGYVHVGGEALNVFGTGLVALGQSDFVSDGETFRIATPTTTYVFEFDDIEANTGVVAGNIPVRYDVGTTRDGLAEAVIQAVLETSLGIAATNLGEGQVELSGRDNDGVVIMGAFNRNTATQIQVFPSAPGLLDAWIDFNRDGDFDDPGEQILASVQIRPDRDNIFEIQAPDYAVTGATIARFRFSSSGGLLPTGFAADGEVEDYVVQIMDGNPPIANTDFFVTNEDTLLNSLSLGRSVLDNDVDPDTGTADNLTVFSYQTLSALGAVVVMNTSSDPSLRGTFTYDPRGSAILQSLDVGQSMVDTFVYRAFDGQFLSTPGTVSITVEGRNDAPVANPDPDLARGEPEIQTPENQAILIRVLDNDFDPEGHPLTITNVTGGLGTTTIEGDVIRYNPSGAFRSLDVGQHDFDSFVYTITDGRGLFASATVTVRILGVNDPPVAVDDFYPSNDTARTDEKTPKQIDVLLNDFDPEGSQLTVVSVQTFNTIGTAVVNFAGTPNNNVTYNPNNRFQFLAVGQTATDTFSYVVRDAQGNTSVATVTVTIDGVNDNPVARNVANVNVARNQTVRVNVLANDTDVDGDDLRVIGVNLTTLGTRGIATINADSTVTYDPNGQFDNLSIGQTATDRFVYTIGDFDANGQALGGSATATVTVTVFGASDPPVANDDQATTNEKDSVAISVLFNDTDDFGPLIVADVDPMNIRGSVMISPLNQPNNLVIYSPDGQFDYLRQGETATEIFAYTVTDGTGIDTALVTVTVTGVNDPPVANIDANGYAVVRGRTLRANDADGTLTPGVPGDDGVLLNDTDAEGDALTAVLETGPTHGVLTLNSDGTFVYTHNGNSATRDTFSYRARDEHGALSLSAVTVVINIVDSPPAEWQNPINRFDVNNDGFVSPIDVLLVINLLNDPDRGIGYVFPFPRPLGSPYFDVDGDGVASPLDALGVINEVNRLNQGGSPEGEADFFSEWDASGQTSTVSWGDERSSSASGVALQPGSQQVVPTAGQERPAESIRIDLFGIEDALSDIVDEVLDAHSEADPWDTILDELLA